jgi:hypothetical protein
VSYWTTLDKIKAHSPCADEWDAALLDLLLYAQGHGISLEQHRVGTPPSDILDAWVDSVPDEVYADTARSIYLDRGKKLNTTDERDATLQAWL